MRHQGMWARALGAICMALLLPSLGHAAADANGVAAMRERYAALDTTLRQNAAAFRRPLSLESSEDSGRVRADVWAVLDQRFATAQAGLAGPEKWCEVLILSVHTRYCNARKNELGQQMVVVYVGTKPDPALHSAYRVEFAPSAPQRSADYFQSVLVAEKGPMATSDYRIVLEAMPAPGNKTFVHLSYTYSVGFAGRIALQAYLLTVGMGKVGFTKMADGSLVGGVRGIVERNVMRYYLAIEAYLAAPERDALDDRMQYWFDAAEQFPRQLHEMERTPYLELKRREYGRQLMD